MQDVLALNYEQNCIFFWPSASAQEVGHVTPLSTLALAQMTISFGAVAKHRPGRLAGLYLAGVSPLF